MKKILFIGATHGNEIIGLEALKKLKNRPVFSQITGNPRALAQQKRFTECDLNRAAPGNPTASEYEKRRATKIIEQTKSYQYTIDLHGTDQNTGIFLLVTNPTPANLRLASYFNIPNLVVWPSITPEMRYPLSEFFSCGLEIESGPQTNPQTTTQLADYLDDFLDNLTEREIEPNWLKRLEQKKLWEMYEPIPAEPDLIGKLAEFQIITHRNETFAPIFVGTYQYKNILGYKLKSYTLPKFKTKFLPEQL